MEEKAKLLLTCIFKDDSEYEMAERMLASFMPYFDGLVVGLTGVSGQWTKLKKLVQHYNGIYVQTSPQTHPDIYAKQEEKRYTEDEYYNEISISHNKKILNKKDLMAHNKEVHESERLADYDEYLESWREENAGKWIFANFAKARNVVFEKASEIQKTKTYDYWSWADVDDVLINGQELNTCALRAKEMNLDCVFFTYWYSVKLDEKGNIIDVVIDHLRERLLKPNTFHWISRLHEVTVPLDPNYQPKQSLYDLNPQEGRNCVWAHVVDAPRMDANLKRNIKILEIQVEEEQQKDPRTIFYLAKTYYDLHTDEYLKKSEELIYKYLELSGWAEERSFAWEYIGNIKAGRGDHRGALDAYLNALREYPARHMIFLLLAREYAELGLMEESNFYLDTALRMDSPKTRTTIGNPMEIKLLAASLKYNNAMRQMKLDDAIHWMKVRNQILGEDDGMLKVLEESKQLNDAAGWVFNFAKYLKDHGYEEKIDKLLQALPQEMGREPFAFMIANEYRKPRVWADNEIAYFASWGSEHFEKWSGKSLEKGIGGSETAVIRLAEEWTKMGYKVTVYGDPREDEGVINGVEYRPWYEANFKDEFNILILWRSPHLMDRDIKAKKWFMDLHDVSSQLDWTESRMQKVDKVFFKSKFHRGMVPKLPDSKAVVISNGI